jgi:hypothetical protein
MRASRRAVPIFGFYDEVQLFHIIPFGPQDNASCFAGFTKKYFP